MLELSWHRIGSPSSLTTPFGSSRSCLADRSPPRPFLSGGPSLTRSARDGRWPGPLLGGAACLVARLNGAWRRRTEARQLVELPVSQRNQGRIPHDANHKAQTRNAVTKAATTTPKVAARPQPDPHGHAGAISDRVLTRSEFFRFAGTKIRTPPRHRGPPARHRRPVCPSNAPRLPAMSFGTWIARGSPRLRRAPHPTPGFTGTNQAQTPSRDRRINPR